MDGAGISLWAHSDDSQASIRTRRLKRTDQARDSISSFPLLRVDVGSDHHGDMVKRENPPVGSNFAELRCIYPLLNPLTSIETRLINLDDIVMR